MHTDQTVTGMGHYVRFLQERFLLALVFRFTVLVFGLVLDQWPLLCHGGTCGGSCLLTSAVKPGGRTEAEATVIPSWEDLK